MLLLTKVVFIIMFIFYFYNVLQEIILSKKINDYCSAQFYGFEFIFEK